MSNERQEVISGINKVISKAVKIHYSQDLKLIVTGNHPVTEDVQFQLFNRRKQPIQRDWQNPKHAAIEDLCFVPFFLEEELMWETPGTDPLTQAEFLQELDKVIVHAVFNLLGEELGLIIINNNGETGSDFQLFTTTKKPISIWLDDLNNDDMNGLRHLLQARSKFAPQDIMLDFRDL